MRTPIPLSVVVWLLISSCAYTWGQVTHLHTSPQYDWSYNRSHNTYTSLPPTEVARPFDPYQTQGARIARGTLTESLRAPLLLPPPNSYESSVLRWHMLPKDNIYPFYLADPKASRLSGNFVRPEGDNLLLDGTLGGRFGLFRLGDSLKSPFRRGIQLDVEASAQVRLDLEQEIDVRSVDFRAGLPLSFAFGRWHARVGYYHLSSHVGDEFLLKNPTFNRVNFSRDTLFAGTGLWITERLRIYAEIGWAFYSDVSQEWEINAGIEYVPTLSTGWRGAPFWAIHAEAREELNYGGSINAQIGWAWRATDTDGLLRIGLNYYEGKSAQWSFFDNYEPLFGLGLWYDY